MTDDRAATHFLFERQGFLLRRQSLELGLTDQALTAMCRRQVLVRIRQGVYCEAGDWVRLTAEERLRRRSRSTYMLTQGVVALSHTSACVEFGCTLWDVPLGDVHLTRLDDGRGRSEADVRHHSSAITAAETCMVGGWLLTSPLRTALDTATLTDAERGLVIVDWFLQQGLFTESELRAAYALRRMWPGSRSLELVTRLARKGSASPGETRLRFLCWQMGLPMPQLQYKIYDEKGRHVATVDMAWPELGIYVEFDGRVKYGRLLKPGQDAGDAVFREKVREDDIRRVTKGTVVRFIWTDLHFGSAPALQLRGLFALVA